MASPSPSTAGATAGDISEERLAALGFYVRDLDRSVEYYTRLLGMRQVARIDSSSDGMDPSDPLNGMTKVYLRYGGEPAALGLALIWSDTGPELQSAGGASTFAGLAVSVPDRTRVREGLLGAGYAVTDPTPPAGPVMRSFGTDPDGNSFEFGEFTGDARATEGSLPGFGFFVRDLDRSVDYYSRLLGMRETGRIESSSDGMDPSDPLNGMTKVYLSYGEGAPMLALVWSADATVWEPVASATTYAGLAISRPELSRVRDDLIGAGCEVSELMSIAGQPATRVFAVDPDGNKLELVEPDAEAKVS
jgi:catechol 2,3-dioxygenase-like lactoylglutathione lyase family enzyme